MVGPLVPEPAPLDPIMGRIVGYGLFVLMIWVIYTCVSRIERWRQERRICRLHLELLRLLAERKDVER